LPGIFLRPFFLRTAFFFAKFIYLCYYVDKFLKA
jgi:hypothetical protein